MGQELTDGDGFFPLVREFREVFGNRLVDPEFPGFMQFGDGRGGGDDLGERGHVVDGIEPGCLGTGKNGPVTKCFLVALPVPFHPENAPWCLARCDGLPDGLIDSNEFCRIEGRLCGAGNR